MTSVLQMQSMIIEFISDHISSEIFLDRLLQLSPVDQNQIQASYLKLLELIIVKLQQAASLSAGSELWKGKGTSGIGLTQ